MRLAICIMVLIQALFTSGCATIKTPKEVDVPLPVSCVKPQDVPAEPSTTSDADLMKMDRRKRTLTVWDERQQLKAYADKSHAMLQACSGGE